MRKNFLPVVLAASFFSATASAQQVNVICSVQADWCNLIATTYARTTGVKSPPGTATATATSERLW